ncbi:adenosylmethionine decarboxylase [Bacillus timonensis]|nr:adenosylmethionine decarboxylase [Bacillus timonensis]
MEYSTYGRHVLLDAWGVDFTRLNDVDALEEKMIEAAVLSGATVMNKQSEAFVPQGGTVLLLLSESHFSIHTYPEKNYASIDCYTCGKSVDPQVAIDSLLDYLKPEKTYGQKVTRGEGVFEVEEFREEYKFVIGNKL